MICPDLLITIDLVTWVGLGHLHTLRVDRGMENLILIEQQAWWWERDEFTKGKMTVFQGEKVNNQREQLFHVS